MNHSPYICGPSCPRCQEEHQRTDEHIATLERENASLLKRVEAAEQDKMGAEYDAGLERAEREQAERERDEARRLHDEHCRTPDPCWPSWRKR